MPELPEIEHLKRSLEPVLLGASVVSAEVRRRDIVHSCEGSSGGRSLRTQLLASSRIKALERRGKNLALISQNSRVVCVHLGMSGQLRFVSAGERLPQTDHVHCIWRVKSKRAEGRLIFRDPRRFGGLWTFPSISMLHERRWNSLGPDALGITPLILRRRLARTNRPVKVALLDQSIIAGIGNIYADEALHRARIHPLAVAKLIPARNMNLLAGAIGSVLNAAINAGGSSIRSYVDGAGTGGSFADRHRVYGRAGLKCLRCGATLACLDIAQRTTVFCSRCQVMFGTSR